MEFTNVTASAKANIYFDGKVVSHGITLEDGSTKTFGVVFAGEYHFGTEKAERMDVIDGACSVVLDGETKATNYVAGEFFEIVANSGFTMTVDGGTAQYICSYIN